MYRRCFGQPIVVSLRASNGLVEIFVVVGDKEAFVRQWDISVENYFKKVFKMVH